MRVQLLGFVLTFPFTVWSMDILTSKAELFFDRPPLDALKQLAILPDPHENMIKNQKYIIFFFYMYFFLSKKSFLLYKFSIF